MNRKAQLQNLVASLARLVEILRLDPQCRWLGHFEACLNRAEELLSSGFTQEQLNELSGSVMYVYGGAGSFGDYSPGVHDAETQRFRPIPGTEGFDDASGLVHEAALSLRVVEPGHGDYARERQELFGKMTVDDWVKEIRQREGED